VVEDTGARQVLRVQTRGGILCPSLSAGTVAFLQRDEAGVKGCITWARKSTLWTATKGANDNRHQATPENRTNGEQQALPGAETYAKILASKPTEMLDWPLWRHNAGSDEANDTQCSQQNRKEQGIKLYSSAVQTTTSYFCIH